MQHIQFNIQGMYCNGCVTSLKQILAQQSGVQNAEVSLDLACAKIDFDETQINPQQLIETIEEAGFDVVIP